MTLEQLGWNPRLENAFQGFAADRLIPARVAREDRGSYVVYTGSRALRATLTGRLRHAAAARPDLPAVGDWVAVRPRTGEQAATIVALVPRWSAILRRAAGERTEPQLIAANVDTLLICCGLDQDYNLRRMERYLTLAYDSGAGPVILLSKADLCPADELDRRISAAEAIAVGVPVWALSVRDGRGVAEARGFVSAGRTAALVGSSGVGKSTLINALLGRELLRTAPTRAHDGRGQHTTTHRELLLLPGGGVLIDTPGMRELQLWGDESRLAGSFADIEGLAAACRFRDCVHEREPGCAVRAAIESGQLDAARMASYRKQLRELRHLARKEDPALARAEREKWKAIHKSAKRWMQEKYRM